MLRCFRPAPVRLPSPHRGAHAPSFMMSPPLGAQSDPTREETETAQDQNRRSRRKPLDACTLTTAAGSGWSIPD